MVKRVGDLTAEEITKTVIPVSSPEKAVDIIFYESEAGNCPFESFYDGLSRAQKTGVLAILGVLTALGSNIRFPQSRNLGDGLFELRINKREYCIRILYFFCEGKVVVLTNGFVKKRKKTPPQEIQLAKDRRKDYLRRKPK